MSFFTCHIYSETKLYKWQWYVQIIAKDDTKMCLSIADPYRQAMLLGLNRKWFLTTTANSKCPCFDQLALAQSCM